jgi:outer membrane lipoprotein SlyB
VLRKVQAQGKITGSSELVLDLQSVKVNGRRYTISTEDIAQKGNEGLGTNKRTAEMVGGGAVLGTLIGAVAGGGRGAAIGAATGAAAGAGTQVLTRGKAVKVPAESTLRFRLDQPLELQPAY